MTLFNYTAIDQSGAEVSGSIDAVTRDVAIMAIQRRGLIISGIESAEHVSFLERNIQLFDRVPVRDVVILSRQISTLFEAQVSALKVFSLLAAEVERPALRTALAEVVDDLRGGSSISKALAKHPKIFSDFYVNMVAVGEESGKLEEIFKNLADYLDRTYEVASKARNALIYPAFVILTFIAVMTLMLTTVIPRISAIIKDTTDEIPVYTRVVMGVSDALVRFGPFLLLLALVLVFVAWRDTRTDDGKRRLDALKLAIPYVGDLYRKLYLSRFADNMHTMLLSGIAMVKALETTSSVVGNRVYEAILLDAVDAVRGGSTVARSLEGHEEIPGIMTQMIKIGEETGELGHILETLSHFYRREVNNAVDTLVDLIEPAMIVLLGAGVGLLLASVLIPIYNIASGI